ncbi:MAG: hypothetical protein FJ295_15335 [Planctomycetes bacterium]|nr:hypothetical protein [Planctomycetota bacterium]
MSRSPGDAPRNARLIIVARFQVEPLARAMRTAGLFVDIPNRSPGGQTLITEPRVISEPQLSMRQLLDAIDQLPEEMRRQLPCTDSIEIQPGISARGSEGASLEASLLQRSSAIGATLRLGEAPTGNTHRVG